MNKSEDPFDFSDDTSGVQPWVAPTNISTQENVPSGHMSPANTTSIGSRQSKSAPVGYLAVALTAVTVSLLLLAMSRVNPLAAATAWLLAGPLSFTMVGFFLGEDARRRSEAYYVEKSWVKPCMQAIVVVAFLLVIASAWFFADWAARQ